MNQKHLRRDLAALVRELRSQIGNEYRASEEGTRPSMSLTVGADRKSWAYQTGDNSYTGGAYSFAHWGVTAIYRDSNSYHVADELLEQLYDLGAFDTPETTGA